MLGNREEIEGTAEGGTGLEGCNLNTRHLPHREERYRADGDRLFTVSTMLKDRVLVRARHVKAGR